MTATIAGRVKVERRKEMVEHLLGVKLEKRSDHYTATTTTVDIVACGIKIERCEEMVEQLFEVRLKNARYDAVSMPVDFASAG